MSIGVVDNIKSVQHKHDFDPYATESHQGIGDYDLEPLQQSYFMQMHSFEYNQRSCKFEYRTAPYTIKDQTCDYNRQIICKNLLQPIYSGYLAEPKCFAYKNVSVKQYLLKMKTDQKLKIIQLKAVRDSLKLFHKLNEEKRKVNENYQINHCFDLVITYTNQNFNQQSYVQFIQKVICCNSNKNNQITKIKQQLHQQQVVQRLQTAKQLANERYLLQTINYKLKLIQFEHKQSLLRKTLIQKQIHECQRLSRFYEYKQVAYNNYCEKQHMKHDCARIKKAILERYLEQVKLTQLQTVYCRYA